MCLFVCLSLWSNTSKSTRKRHTNCRGVPIRPYMVTNYKTYTGGQ